MTISLTGVLLLVSVMVDELMNVLVGNDDVCAYDRLSTLKVVE